MCRDNISKNISSKNATYPSSVDKYSRYLLVELFLLEKCARFFLFQRVKLQRIYLVTMLGIPPL